MIPSTSPISEPFFLLDQNLSYRIAREVSTVSGIAVTSTQYEWPGRELNVNPPQDWEIIPYLGTNAGHLGVWITLDWAAFSQHLHLIDRYRISVVWLRGPDGRNFSRQEQTLLLIRIIGTARRLVLESDVPVYLRAGLNADRQQFLDRLQGSLRDAPQVWQRVPLD